MKTLVVVDMQNDFVSGVLGSGDALKIVPAVVEKVKSFDGRIIFTRDTHGKDYLKTQEGRKLPVEHCIKDTEGWELIKELEPYAEEIADKVTFASTALPEIIGSDTEEIQLCGLCTDICVISNAMLLKAHFPEIKIAVDASCCAGVTRESHKTALEAMRAVQIEIINE